MEHRQGGPATLHFLRPKPDIGQGISSAVSQTIRVTLFGLPHKMASGFQEGASPKGKVQVHGIVVILS